MVIAKFIQTAGITNVMSAVCLQDERNMLFRKDRNVNL